MKFLCFIQFFLFAVSITNSSFVCIKPHKIVSIDSVHYFKPDQIIFTPDNFNDAAIRLKFNDNFYTFYKDTSTNYHVYKADKDDKNIFILLVIKPGYIGDSLILTTIKYQSFSKVELTNSSKVFKIKDVPFSLKSLRSFIVSKEDFDKIFINKKK